MPQHPSKAFLLWRRAAESGDWDSVLGSAVSEDSWLALQGLTNCMTVDRHLAKATVKAIWERGR